MLFWSAVFLLIAIAAAIPGFSGIAAGAATIAQVLFFIFLGVSLLVLIAGIVTGTLFSSMIRRRHDKAR